MMGAVLTDPAAAPAEVAPETTSTEKIRELLAFLNLIGTGQQVDTLYEWAGRHFGMVDDRPKGPELAMPDTVGAVAPSDAESRLSALEATLGAIAAKLGV